MFSDTAFTFQSKTWSDNMEGIELEHCDRELPDMKVLAVILAVLL